MYFLALCLAIALAVFQKKWIGKPSGLTGFLIFCNVLFLAILTFFTVVPIIADRTGGKRIVDLERAMRENRLGFVGNGFLLAFGAIIAVTQLISSVTSKGCKNHDDDPHAGSSKGNDDDYKNALTNFCGTKRAEAAFLWIGFFGLIALALLFLYQFRLSRKAGPRIPPFVHPGGDSEGAFEPIAGIDDEDDDDDPHAGPYGKTAGEAAMAAYQQGGGYDDDPRYAAGVPGGYAPTPVVQQTTTAATPAAAPYRNPVSNIEARYGMGAGAGGGASYEAAQNPFAAALANAKPLGAQQQQQQAALPDYTYGAGAPVRQSYDYGAYSGANPYDAVQRQVGGYR